MKTLKLFNAVLSKPVSGAEPFISNDGIIIMPDAQWALDKITTYYAEQKLSGKALNKTFHKSWSTILSSTREELAIEQIRHYISTYGSDFQDEVYIPCEELDLPKCTLKYKVIHALTKQELIEKSLKMLKSGMALEGTTIDDILEVLTDTCGYVFTGDEGIKNKEAIIKIADTYGIVPKDTLEFFRYIIYRATGDSLLIKNKATVKAIKASSFNPGPQFTIHGLEKLAAHFNRFKPLFLAFKSKCPTVINKISKLSKTEHRPMVQSPLNTVTSTVVNWHREYHWLESATTYSILKALIACHNRLEGQESFVYRIRNGKSWTTEKSTKNAPVTNYRALLDYLKKTHSFEGKKFYIPDGVEYAIPTSEKMYIGNVPTGTKFYADKMAVGIYWENSWGARDHDISGVNLNGKVGWNSNYSQRGMLAYSGDLTDAIYGAVEYLYADKGLTTPTLVKNNVYCGKDDAGYSIIIGKGDGVTRKYMMNPDNLMASIRTNSVSRQTYLGAFLPEESGQSFVLLNTGSGGLRVSGNSEQSKVATDALLQQYKDPFSFNKLIEELGGEIVTESEEVDYDLSLDSLEKDTFISILEEAKEIEENT